MSSMSVRFAVTVTLALALPAASAMAQPATIKETVVVTATAAPESLFNVGRTVVLLTGEELRQLPIVSVTDALRLVSSVDVRSRGPRGIQSDLSVRGATFSQALVLVDGVPINDAQSGHHNSDIPVPLEEVDRIELVLGAGSSLHGADATGGTVNVITRNGGRRFLADLSAGQHGLVETSATAGVVRSGIEHVLSGAFLRSSGFMPARDHIVALGRYQATLRQNTTATVGFLDKEFGANGFYGPAPSREWTDQLLATVQHRYARAARWQATADVSYRTHGDHFIYDERTPSLSESRHRTHALASNLRWHGTVSRRTQVSLAAGGGYDTIDSNNLGDHAFSRGSLGAELRQSLGSRIVLHPGLRVDTSGRFGTSWSPSLSVSGWASDRVRVRASAGHAFRVPTFTELFYVDPNHQGAGALSPEEAWSADAGIDLLGRSWTAGATVFKRWEDDVIDWVRPSAAVRWRTANIRHVDTQGVETSVQRRLAGGGQARLQYTWLTSEGPAPGLLSKYVLDSARHSLAASGSAAWRGVRLGSRAEWKRRVDGRSYWTVDAQAARAVRRVELYVQMTNLFDESYQEIRGVDMPGRWLKAGVKVR
jgi:outer membrane cobalamin receptor